MDKNAKKKSIKAPLNQVKPALTGDGTYIKTSKKGVDYKSISEKPSKATKRITSNENNVSLKDLTEIESANADIMKDSSAMELLEELNNKYKIPRLFRKTFWSGLFVIFVLLISGLPALFKVFVIILIIMLNAFSYINDQKKKVTQLFYDFDPETERAYFDLIKSFECISACSKKWHVSSQANSSDWKRNAGASSLVIRKPIIIKNQSPPYIKTNILVPMIPVGKQKLYFFPERVLVYDNEGIGAVNYCSLKLSVNCIEFVEHSTPPADAKIVGETWKYPNKKGGPDKRFANNKQLPVMQYDEILFSSNSGLNELIQISRCNVAINLSETIANIARILN